MPQIFQMPPQMANLIAAGEVVERPGSVAKELVENAVDAGAKHITVEIRNGGVTYLRVTDDGKGILPEDVRTAFLRHATSKVRTPGDLESIGTLGFRGEALAAVSSVARVDMFTRTAENTEGIQITLEGGRETGYGETGCPVGTTVVIRDLFFNVPARAKFLKKDVTEGGYVENVVTQIAVSQPEIAFRLIKDGRESFSTPGDGKMLSAIFSTGGRDLAGRMLSLAVNMGEVYISGYIAPPEITRAARNQQHFYLNGRTIRSRLLTGALEEGYKGRLMSGRYPVCYLHLSMHPSAVDVNVHPAKRWPPLWREAVRWPPARPGSAPVPGRTTSPGSSRPCGCPPPAPRLFPMRPAPLPEQRAPRRRPFPGQRAGWRAARLRSPIRPGGSLPPSLPRGL